MAWMAIPGIIGGGIALYNALSKKGDVNQEAKPYKPDEARYGLGYQLEGSQAAGIAKGYEKTAGTYTNRPFVQANEQNMNAARDYQTGSRAETYAAMEEMRSAARGETPSQAAALAQRNIEQAAAMQMGAAAATRGGGMQQASAQRAAAIQGAQMQQAGILQAAELRAQEMAAARQAYMQGTLGIRGQDIGLMGTESQFALGQGQLALGSQAQNQAAALAYAQMAMQTREQERQAMLALESLKGGQYSQAQAQNLAIAQHNAQMDLQRSNALVGALMGGATAGLSMMGGGEAAAGAGNTVATQATGTGSALGAGSGSAAAGAGMTSGRPWP